MSNVWEFIKNKKVLIVEDDEAFRKTLASLFEGKGCQVREAENGQVALTILNLNDCQFDLVISDVRMPVKDGIELLKEVRASNSKIKFVIMTGFSEVLQTKEAYDLGANGFLPKPFRVNELVMVLSSVFELTPQHEQLKKETPVEYCRINIKDFVSGSRVPADLYLRLSETKYVKIAHEGEVIPIQRVQNYKEKKVDYLYIRSSDFQKYVGVSLLVTKAVKKSDISNEKKWRCTRALPKP